MNKESWNPGHSLNKGYPYAQVESKVQLVDRIKIQLEENGTLSLMGGKFVYPKEAIDQLTFLFSRYYDIQEALKTAEDQIAEILEEDPFIPEDLGFELVHKPEQMSDSPIRIYSAKFDERFSLHREIVDLENPNLDASKWVIMKKQNDSDKFDKIEVRLPCYRIAYAVFSALGIIMTQEEFESDIIEEVIPE